MRVELPASYILYDKAMVPVKELWLSVLTL